MVTRADWIPVQLDALAQSQARAMAVARIARGGRFTVVGHTIGREVTGAAGELAFAQYLGRPHPDPTGSLAHQLADSDLYGWQVRTAGKPSYGLNLHQGDSGKRFAFILGHTYPLMWLAGWIIADWNARRVAVQMQTPGGKDGGRWWRVDQAHLRAFADSKCLSANRGDRTT